MPSSISSSEIATASQAKGRRALVSAVVLLALVALALEAAGLGFSRISRIQQRIESEYRAAIKLGPGTDKPTLLVVGNSLGLEGINLPELREQSKSDYDSSRFFVEQTSYSDWYYGLRRLLHAGARPRVIVLCLSSRQFLADGVRWNYFAHFMMDLRDYPSVVRREKLDPTSASNYLFAHWSAWLGIKTEIRNYLLVKALPDIVEFGNLFPGSPPPIATELVSRVSAARFGELREICAPYGTRLILLIPPNLDANDPVGDVEKAGRKAGVPVLDPYGPGEMPAKYFRDGFHLNDQGADLFTRRLAAELHEGR